MKYYLSGRYGILGRQAGRLCCPCSKSCLLGKFMKAILVTSRVLLSYTLLHCIVLEPRLYRHQLHVPRHDDHLHM